MTTIEPERRDWLAVARERTGRSQESLARYLGVSSKTVSYWERGLNTPRVEIRPDLAEALGLTIDELSRRLGLASEQTANGTGGNVFESITGWLSMFVRAEQSAYAIWTFEVTTLPALCQTAGYARAVEETGHRPFSPDEINDLVRTRLARAAVLDTAEFTALIPGPLLGAVTGSPTVMVEQMAHLRDLADRPNVTLLVIDPEHMAAAPGRFTLLATSSPVPDTAIEVGLRGPSYTEGATATADYVRLFDHLASWALGPEASRARIARTADRFAAMTTLQKGTHP
jgi:transcriptional regulator with XRE-family HTH domain